MAMRKFKVAAVQLDLSKPHKEIIESMRYYLRQAKREGAKIVCFPEDTFYAGPAKNSKMIEAVREECRIHQIWAIVVAHMKERKHVYNQALLIDDEGNICGKHKKVHVCDPPNVRAGSHFDIYDTPFCKIGIAICWDVSSPPALYQMAKQGATLVFCPLYWCYEDWQHPKYRMYYEKKILESLILARSFDNLIYTVFCNAYDPKDRSLVPYSAISSPHRIMREIFQREGMITATIDLDYLERMQEKYEELYSKRIRTFGEASN